MPSADADSPRENVAAADDHHVLAQLGGTRGAFLAFFQELDDVHLLAVLQTGAALVPGAGGEDDVGIALIKELLRALDLGVEDHLGTHGLHELHIVVDGGGGDTEGGDHVAHDAAQGILALKDGHVHAGTAQEVGGRHTGRAAADDGNFQFLEERRVAYGAVGNAHARVRAFAGAALLAEAGPAGHDDRSGGDFGTVFERDDLLAVANFQFLHGSGAEFGLEMLGMGAEGVRSPEPVPSSMPG